VAEQAPTQDLPADITPGSSKTRKHRTEIETAILFATIGVLIVLVQTLSLVFQSSLMAITFIIVIAVATVLGVDGS